MEKQELKPAGVFKYFAEICQVPRPSKTVSYTHLTLPTILRV